MHVNVDIPDHVARHVIAAEDYSAKAHASASDAVRYAVAAGCELIRIRAALHGTFSALLRNGMLTSIPARTASNYMALAERMLPADTVRAITAPAQAEIMSPSDGADANPIDALATIPTLSADDGRTLTQLYRDYGIITRGKQGGRRAGAGRKRAEQRTVDDADAQYALLRAEYTNPLDQLSQAIYSGPIDRLTTEDLNALVAAIDGLANTVRYAIAKRG